MLVIINFILKMETSFTVLIFQNFSLFNEFNTKSSCHTKQICVVLELKEKLD